MSRTIFDEEHNMFRDSVRKFCEQELVPNLEKWDKDGMVSRETWLKAGENGFLGMSIPEEYGGLGLDDFRYNAVIGEEMAYCGATGPGFTLQNDITVGYIIRYGTEEQKKKYLPGIMSGEIITAIAMTEPGTGSDLQGIATFAKDHGDHYVMNGQKTFITNGVLCDLCIVVARTSKEKGHKSMSLFLVESAWDGYAEGKKLEKIGMHSQDTAELFFEDVIVPKENLLGGEEGLGFVHLMQQLPEERLSIAIAAVATCEEALRQTIEYCHERTAFGQEIGKFQNSRFKLAEMKTETEIARVFVDHCLELVIKKELSVEKAAMAKYWTTDLQQKVVTQCLQLYGGYGFMKEYPIGRMFCDSRITTIFGGTNEVMKEIIGRGMGF
jgi:alkylation response protein AidB-like acyl-CoA dehydrogenase